jgi:adenine-specific DNA methylase
MLGAVEALKISEGVVIWIPVAVVNVATARNRAERALPNISMQLLAATRPITLARPAAVQAAIKIDSDGVKVDWISEPLVRSLAYLHPLTVKNE